MLRTKPRCSIRGTTISDKYWPWPRIRRTSSLRLIDLPTHESAPSLILMALLSMAFLTRPVFELVPASGDALTLEWKELLPLLRTHGIQFGARGLDRLDDMDVARAGTE